MKRLEQFKFYGKLLLQNRRNSIIMFIGLGISLALVAQSLMFMYSFQFGAFTGFYRDVPTRQMTIGIGTTDISETKDTIIKNLNKITNDVIEEIDFTDKIETIDWFIGRGLFLCVNTTTTNDYTYVANMNLHGIPPDYLSALEDMLYNGSLPKKPGDVIVVAEERVLLGTNLSNLGEIPAYNPVFALPPPTFEEIVFSPQYGMANGYGAYMNVTGIISSEVFTNPTGTYAQDIRTLVDYLGEACILTSYTNFVQILDDIEYLHNLAFPQGRISFDLSLIDSFRISQEIATINHLSQELTRAFDLAEYEVHVYPVINDYLEDFQKEFIAFQLFGILFITPIIGMALSLTNYSANLMKRRQKRQVSNMLQRGSSRGEVVTLLISQVVELTITAIIISIIIGYGFSFLINKSAGFMNFSGPIQYPALNFIIFIVVIAGGMVLAILINAVNIWKMSQITTYEAYSEHEEKQANWEKLYLDFVLLILGIALWLIVRTQLKGVSAYQFAYGLGTTAPVLLVLGGILLTARLYPRIIDYGSKLAWKAKNLEIIGFAFKRSSRRRTDTIRSLVLITLTFTLIFSSLITISSYQDFDEENAYYALGSDILVRGVDVFNDNTLNTVLEIEGVESATYLKATTQIVTYGGVTFSYKVLGIDPEGFAKTAYFDKEYLDGQDPIQFFSQLESSDQVFMQKDQLENVGKEVGDSFSIVYYKYPFGDLNRTVQIIDTYNFLPRFFTEYPKEDSTVYRFNLIGLYTNVEAFASETYNIAGDLLVKVTDGQAISDVAEEIEDALGRSVESVVGKTTYFEGSLRNIMLYGSVNSSFISSLIITVTAIILMIVIQSIENEREVVTLKILGISPKQLFSMFLTQAISIVTFGSIIGAGLGTFAASMFTEILTYETLIPRSELSFPIGELAIAFVILYVSSIIAAALTSWIIFRKDTIKAMKQI
ncbi:MAG: ABC transporter permease [Candidatus Heimdallarchaeota archaeon]|nr:ABC transporter permease [Candidatus Heimdallarchaeota archaeon]